MLEQKVKRSGGVAFVELPPYGDAREILAATTSFHATLREDHQWFVQTPVYLAIEDGVVREAVQGETVLSLARHLVRKAQQEKK